MMTKMTENNTKNNYGVPAECIHSSFLESMKTRTCTYYLEHPDELANVDWTRKGNELKGSVKKNLNHRYLQYVLAVLELKNRISESLLVFLVNHNDFEEFKEAVSGSFLSALCKGDEMDQQKFLEHLGDLYYAVKLDYAEERETAAFLNDPERNAVQEMKTVHNDGLDEEELEHNAEVFTDYQNRLKKYIHEMHKTNAVWFRNSSYAAIKEKMAQFNRSLRKTLSVNRDAAELKSNAGKFGEVLQEITEACDAYEEKQMSVQETKKHTLSRLEKKRMRVAEEIRQLNARFHAGSEQQFLPAAC